MKGCTPDLSLGRADTAAGCGNVTLVMARNPLTLPSASLGHPCSLLVVTAPMCLPLLWVPCNVWHLEQVAPVPLSHSTSLLHLGFWTYPRHHPLELTSASFLHLWVSWPCLQLSAS